MIAGVLAILKYYGVISFSNQQIIGTTFVFYSVPTVYISLENGRRERLVWATILFCAGVVFIVKSYFEILDTRGIVFTSILFGSGAVLLLLFIDNTKQKLFLILSIIMMILSYLSATFFKNWGLFTYTNKIGDVFEIFWPVILIVFGMSIFINRRNSR